jgi:hypothetical protein
MRHREGSVLIALACGCGPQPGGDTGGGEMGSTTTGSATETSGGSSGDTSGATTESSATTTSGVDGSVSGTETGTITRDCLVFDNEAACIDAELDLGRGWSCAWVEVLPVRRIDACEYGDPTEICVGSPGSTGGGCVTPEGCGDAGYYGPSYRALDDGWVGFVDFCNSPTYHLFEYCESGLAANADPPECACVCELWP